MKSVVRKRVGSTGQIGWGSRVGAVGQRIPGTDPILRLSLLLA